MTGSAGPSPDPVAVAALRTSRIANAVAVVSLLAAGGSAYFTYQQAQEAKRANDNLQASQADNVYIDSPELGSDGRRRYFIRNRNRQPVAQVYYTYRLGDAEPGPGTTIGVLPGCSSVEMYPANNDGQRPDFVPSAVYFDDPSATAWRHDLFAAPVRISGGPSVGRQLGSSGAITEIKGCAGQ